MSLDFEKIKETAEGYREDMCRFLRAMISHPSESCEEKEVAECIYTGMVTDTGVEPIFSP